MTPWNTTIPFSQNLHLSPDPTSLTPGARALSSSDSASAPQPARELPRIVLADEHLVVSAGLAALLKSHFELVDIVADGRELIRSVAERQPNIVLTDISLPRLNGLDAIQQIRKLSPFTSVIILTMHDDPQLAVQAFQSGAKGYLLKASPSHELIDAIKEVAHGGQYLTSLLSLEPSQLLAEAGTRAKRGSLLTRRQREILQLIGEGQTMRQAAETLGISRRTAESHKYEIMRVLEARNGAELVRHAIRLGLVGS